MQLAGRQCSLRHRVTFIRKPQAKQRAKAKAKAQACVWALGAHLSPRALVLHLLADGWLDPALLCSRQRGRQHNLADNGGKELEGIVETTFERTPDTDILALAGMVCPFRQVRNQGCGAVWAAVTHSTVVNGAEPQRH